MNIPELRRKAESGSCVAQSVLGLCYLFGLDVEVNYEEAFKLLSAAANQGSSRAVLNLGRMYAQGLGVTQNVPEATRLFQAVGTPDDSTDAFAARIELGRIFSRGVGVTIDKTAAVKWYSAAIAVAGEEDDSEELHEAHTDVQQA